MGNAAIGRLMLNVLGSFAEFERDLTASRIAEARAHLKAHGRRIAGAIPFGYAADPHTKQLEVCEEEASAVVRMFQWAAQGITPSVIASYANALRWITGAGKPWTARQVLSILSNHVYAGLVVHGFAFVEGCHPALIDRDTYHKVQNLIAARRTGVAGRHGGRSGITWIVLGFLICGKCGRLMSSHAVRSGPVIRPYYRCRSTAGGQEPCKGVMVAAHAVETAVLTEIGADSKLTLQEQADLVKERVRKIVYDANLGKVRIEMIKPPDGWARDEAEATDRRAGTVRRKPGPRHR